MPESVPKRWLCQFRSVPDCDTIGGVATIGYMRVSTLKQVNDRQEDALRGYGCDRVFEDKMTGARFDRAGLTALLDFARPGDVVLCSSFDRLGRSLLQAIETANKLHGRGIVLRTLKEGIDYSTSTGRMLAGVFASLAEYERELINERAADARAAAKARNASTGRPSRLTEDQKRQVRALHASGESVPALVKTFAVSRRTVYRALEVSVTSSSSPVQ
jgi:DNA invertase Pin-like site-specific DNA recombinase